MDDLINRQYAIETLLAEGLITAAVYIERMPSADLSEYSDKLWKTAYERGKAEARVIKLTEADKESLRKAMENAELTLVAEPRKGKWIIKSDTYHEYWECDQCGMGVGLDDVRNYCPNCGARMEE